MKLDDHNQLHLKQMIEDKFPGFLVDLTTLHPEVNTNSLSVFKNEVIDYIAILIDWIKKSKDKL